MYSCCIDLAACADETSKSPIRSKPGQSEPAVLSILHTDSREELEALIASGVNGAYDQSLVDH